MILLHTIKSALSGLLIHKGRSALTVLGIVIGVMSIILIVSIGKGAEGLILKEIGGLGADTIVIRPGKEPTGPTDLIDTMFSDSLTKKDLVALKKESNVPYLKEIAPAIFMSASVSYKGETYRPQIFGWNAEFMGKMFDIYPEYGRNFGETEIKQKASVAIVGYEVAEELFGGGEVAVGKYMNIKGKRFRVLGVLPKKGQVVFLNVDKMVLIPPSTAQTYLLGIDYYHEILVKVESPELVDRTVVDIENTLRETHGITDSDKDDFFVETQQNMIEQVGSILGILTAFLSSVVAVALLVGGIGVMNIMLVTVTERTREIGLRKAVGATNRDILRQFLVESVFLTIAGGVIGIIIGFILSLVATYGISVYLDSDWVFSFPVNAAILAVVVSAIVGVVFGLYPARKASRKSPIEALRYE